MSRSEQVELSRLRILVGQGIQIEHRLRKALEIIRADVMLPDDTRRLAKNALLGEP